jgi:hypothetical protein
MLHLAGSFLTLLIATGVVAMECSRAPLENSIQRADFIFFGTIQRVDPVKGQHIPEKPDCGGKIATFKVEKVWKGMRKKRVRIYSEDACYSLGQHFKKGEKYIVFARVEPDSKNAFDFSDASGCNGTERAERADGLLGKALSDALSKTE